MTFLLPDILTRPGRWALSGTPEGQDARLLVALAARQGGRGVLQICRDDARMATLEAALRFCTRPAGAGAAGLGLPAL